MTIEIDDYFNEVICDNSVRIKIGDYGRVRDLISCIEEENGRKLSDDEITIIHNAFDSYEDYKEQKEIRKIIQQFSESIWLQTSER